MKRIRLLAPAALLLALAAAPGLQAQDTAAISKKAFSSMVDKDALLFVHVKDVEKLRANLDKAGLKEIMENAQVKEFIEYVKNKAAEGAAGAENPFKDVTLTQVLDAAGGEVAFVVGAVDIDKMIKQAAEGDQPDPPQRIYLLVNAKGKADDFQKLVDRVIGLAVAEGGKKAEEAYKGAKLTTLTPPDATPVSPTIARIGSVFALGLTADGVKDLVRRGAEGEAESLASNPLFVGVSKTVGPDADAMAYVNLEAIFKAVKKAMDVGAESGALGPLGDFTDDIFEGLGLETPKAAGMGLTVAADQVTQRAYLHAPAGLKGLLKSFFPRGDNPAIPDYVPANAHGFSTTRFDFKGFYETLLEDIIGPVAKGRGVEAQMWVDQAEAMLNIDLDDDLFGNLTGEMTTVSKFEGALDAGVTALSVKDLKKFKAAFKSVTEFARNNAGQNFQMDEEEYVGGTLYSFGEGAPVAMGLKEKAIFVGPAAAVKESMRLAGKGEPTLADDPTYKGLSKLLPATYQSVGYSSKAGFVRVLNSIRTGEVFDAFPNQGGFDAEAFKEQFDYTKIPDAEILTKNLVGMLSYSEHLEEGVRVVSIAKLKGK